VNRTVPNATSHLLKASLGRCTNYHTTKRQCPMQSNRFSLNVEILREGLSRVLTLQVRKITVAMLAKKICDSALHILFCHMTT